MTLDQRLRDDLRTAADRITDDRADVAEVIRSGRRRRIAAPAVGTVGVLAAVAIAVSLIGPPGDPSQSAGLPTTDDATLDAAIGDFDNLVLRLCDGRYCLADDEGHQELAQLLTNDPDVEAFYYVSKEQAAERVMDLYRADPENSTASFVVVLADDADPSEVAERYREAPGVESWSSPEELDAAEETDDPRHGLPEPDVAIFLCDDTTCPAITEEQRRGLERQLTDDPYAMEFEFESREDAYARFEELFDEEPELVDSITPDALPESFRVQVRADADADTVIEHYGSFEGVADVVWRRDTEQG